MKQAHYLKLHQEYIDIKITYWKAVAINNTVQMDAAKNRAEEIAIKLPKNLGQN